MAPERSSKHGADINAHTKVTIPKGEYVAACPATASGTGIIRQRALPAADGGMTPLLFAIPMVTTTWCPPSIPG